MLLPGGLGDDGLHKVITEEIEGFVDVMDLKTGDWGSECFSDLVFLAFGECNQEAENSYCFTRDMPPSEGYKLRRGLSAKAQDEAFSPGLICKSSPSLSWKWAVCHTLALTGGQALLIFTLKSASLPSLLLYKYSVLCSMDVFWCWIQLITFLLLNLATKETELMLPTEVQSEWLCKDQGDAPDHVIQSKVNCVHHLDSRIPLT